MGFGIWDLGFGIWDLGFGIWNLELKISPPAEGCPKGGVGTAGTGLFLKQKRAECKKSLHRIP
ncbi:hypothetical protein DHB64_13830 [Antarcticibacterium sp. W02-3]|nr:hypothetical protein [Antarcticibacterium sp. W02-3]